MIQLSRACVRQFRAALKKVGAGKNQRPIVEVVASHADLRLRGVMPDVTIELKLPGSSQEESIRIPFEALADFEAKSDATVTLVKSPGGMVASWDDGRIPQRKSYTLAESANEQLTVPEVDWSTAAVVPGLVQALGHAKQCLATDNVRYATDKIQLQGERGTINATDGRQALIQSGFAFPWKEDLLIPGLELFACRELLPDLPATVAKGKNRIAIQVGDWTIYLVFDTQGRFPDIGAVVPHLTASASTLRLAPNDADFLTMSLTRLPGSREAHAPMTVDLNGQVALRVKEEGQDNATEVILTDSHVIGAPVRLHTDRRFLARAVSFGFTELTILDADKPVVCKDATRTYIWVPLAKTQAIPPNANVTRISTQPGTHPPQPLRERTKHPMAQAPTNGAGNVSTNGNGHAHGPEITAKTNTLAALIAEAQSLKEYLHEGYSRASRLAVALKRHRQQSRLVASTLASLRQLQQIEA